MLALSSFGMGCGETAGVEGGSISGQGDYFNPGLEGEQVATTGMFADGVVTDAEYDQ